MVKFIKESNSNQYIILGIQDNGTRVYYNAQEDHFNTDANDATVYDEKIIALDDWNMITNNGKKLPSELKRVFVPVYDKILFSTANESASFNESWEKIIELNFSNDSKLWSDQEDDRLYEITHNGVMIDQVNDDVPLGWDSVITDISNGVVTITGDFGQQGTYKGSVVITLPADRMSRLYKVFLEPVDSEAVREIMELKSKYNL